MSHDEVAAESRVSGNQANIPARIRRQLDIDDGDQLRWSLDENGCLHVEVVRQRTGTFDDFEGYEGDVATDATSDHDEWGVQE